MQYVSLYYYKQWYIMKAAGNGLHIDNIIMKRGDFTLIENQKINAKKKDSRPSQVRAAREYNKRTLTQIKFYLHNEKDAALIEHLKSQFNTSGYIKKLIIDDMNGGDKENVT